MFPIRKNEVAWPSFIWRERERERERERVGKKYPDVKQDSLLYLSGVDFAIPLPTCHLSTSQYVFSLKEWKHVLLSWRDRERFTPLFLSLDEPSFLEQRSWGQPRSSASPEASPMETHQNPSPPTTSSDPSRPPPPPETRRTTPWTPPSSFSLFQTRAKQKHYPHLRWSDGRGGTREAGRRGEGCPRGCRRAPPPGLRRGSRAPPASWRGRLSVWRKTHVSLSCLLSASSLSASCPWSLSSFLGDPCFFL